MLERRLQTVAYRKGLAHTPKQARQFITHGHVTVNGQRVSVPSYKVEIDEEGDISFDEHSPLADELHPERRRVTIMSESTTKVGHRPRPRIVQQHHHHDHGPHGCRDHREVVRWLGRQAEP